MPQALLPFVEHNPATAANACVIWLHGLGDSGHGFAPIVPHLKLAEGLAVRFVFPHAPERPVTINGGMRMRAWYDLKSMDFNNRVDTNGVIESATQVEQLIDHEIANGIPASRIILVGFSQGGVVTLHLSTRTKLKLAGVIALSTYMNEPHNFATQQSDHNKATPFMVAHGQFDDVVPVDKGKQAFDKLIELGYDATWHTYPIQHNVDMNEINDIANFISAALTNK